MYCVKSIEQSTHIHVFFGFRCFFNWFWCFLFCCWGCGLSGGCTCWCWWCLINKHVFIHPPKESEPTFFIPSAITSDNVFPFKASTNVLISASDPATPTSANNPFTSASPNYIHSLYLDELFLPKSTMHKQQRITLNLFKIIFKSNSESILYIHSKKFTFLCISLTQLKS